MNKINPIFKLPSKGSLTPNGPDDPLNFYYRPLVGYLYYKRLEHAMSLLKPSYSSILEIGYGCGILMPHLCSLSKDVVGVDSLSDPKIVNANLRKMDCNPRLLKGMAQDIDFSGNRFDLVISISMFEHIPQKDIDSLLRNIKKILKPGGHLLVGMRRVDKFMERLFPLIGYFEIKAHHITNYKEFLELAEKYFKLERLKKLPGFLPRFAALYYNMLFCNE